MKNKNVSWKLGHQMLSTSSRSAGMNWAQGRPVFSQMDVGVGPLTLTFGDWGWSTLFKNAGTVVTHGIGFGDVLFGDGEVEFHKDDLAFEFYGGGVKNKLWSSDASGFYSLVHKRSSTLGKKTLNHELIHVWQSRHFGNYSIPLWGLSGFQSWLVGYPYRDYRDGTTNFFEVQADN